MFGVSLLTKSIRKFIELRFWALKENANNSDERVATEERRHTGPAREIHDNPSNRSVHFHHLRSSVDSATRAVCEIPWESPLNPAQTGTTRGLSGGAGESGLPVSGLI